MIDPRIEFTYLVDVYGDWDGWGPGIKLRDPEDLPPAGVDGGCRVVVFTDGSWLANAVRRRDGLAMMTGGAAGDAESVFWRWLFWWLSGEDGSLGAPIPCDSLDRMVAFIRADGRAAPVAAETAA